MFSCVCTSSTQWDDGRRRRERQHRLPAVPVGQVADDRRQHQRAQARNLFQGKNTNTVGHDDLELLMHL